MFQTEYDLGPDVMTYQALAVGCVKQKQGLDLLEEMSVSIPVFLLHMVTSGPLYLSLCHFLSCLICHIIPMHYCSCLPCLTLPCPILPCPAPPCLFLSCPGLLAFSICSLHFSYFSGPLVISFVLISSFWFYILISSPLHFISFFCCKLSPFLPSLCLSSCPLPSPPLPSFFLCSFSSCLLISTLLSFNNFVPAFPLVYWIKSKHSCLWNISCTCSKKRRLRIPH